MTTQYRGGNGIGADVQHARDEAKEVGGELAGILGDMRVLAGKEAELAKAEVAEGARAYGVSAGIGAAAALFAILTSVFLFLTLMLGLDEFMQLWLAALITTAVLALLTASFGLLARSGFKKASVVPQRAIKSIQEDIRWAKSQMKFSER